MSQDVAVHRYLSIVLLLFSLLLFLTNRYDYYYFLSYVRVCGRVNISHVLRGRVSAGTDVQKTEK